MLAGLGLTTSGSLLGALNKFLHALHPPGLSSYGLDVGLGPLTMPEARLAELNDALHVWRSASSSAEGRLDIGDVVLGWGGAIQAYDTIPVLALFLGRSSWPRDI